MLKADVSGGWEELRQEICESLNSILTYLDFGDGDGSPWMDFLKSSQWSFKVEGKHLLVTRVPWKSLEPRWGDGYTASDSAWNLGSLGPKFLAAKQTKFQLLGNFVFVRGQSMAKKLLLADGNDLKSFLLDCKTQWIQQLLLLQALQD